MQIHPTASVHPSAQLPDEIEIGPHAVIDAGVTIGSGCTVNAHAIVTGETIIGTGNEIGYGAVIGAPPQDLTFKPDTRSRVIIGNRNIFREYVTIHRGNKDETDTAIGDQNFFMVGVHLAHNVRVGNHAIFANNVLLGGHVTVGDRAFFGGASAFHQFARVGRLAMIQGMMIGNRDTPPFCIGHGYSRIAGLNVVGLRRAGFSAETRRALKETYFILFDGKRLRKDAIREARESASCPECHELIDFVETPSRQGLCAPDLARGASGGGSRTEAEDDRDSL
jgi:UDP-N-acetylglucosamine acyltransferase